MAGYRAADAGLCSETDIGMTFVPRSYYFHMLHSSIGENLIRLEMKTAKLMLRTLKILK